MFEYIEVVLYVLIVGFILVYLDISFNQRK